MTSPFSARDAVAYNAGMDGSLWKRTDLPGPLNHPGFGSDTPGFALGVATFQTAVGLLVDGKLGPNTLAALSQFRPYEPGGDGDCPTDADYSQDDAAPGSTHGTTWPPARVGVSNKLIVDGTEVAIPTGMIDAGITCSNWQADGDKHFDFRRRTAPMRHFVLHESVTTSVAATIRVLEAKRRRNGYDYGVHFTLAADGHIHQHNDPVQHRLVHANQLNDSSAGIEITNPYNPKFGGAPWTTVIPGPWWCWKPRNAAKVYTLPTPAQLRAVAPLCRLLAEACPDLPLDFPTRALDRRHSRIDRWSDGAKPAPGIVAHRDFASHADGRYPLEYVIARHSEG